MLPQLVEFGMDADSESFFGVVEEVLLMDLDMKGTCIPIQLPLHLSSQQLLSLLLALWGDGLTVNMNLLLVHQVTISCGARHHHDCLIIHQNAQSNENDGGVDEEEDVGLWRESTRGSETYNNEDNRIVESEHQHSDIQRITQLNNMHQNSVDHQKDEEGVGPSADAGVQPDAVVVQS